MSLNDMENIIAAIQSLRKAREALLTVGVGE